MWRISSSATSSCRWAPSSTCCSASPATAGGWDNYKKEVNTGKGLKMHDWMRGYLTYGLPLIVLFIFVFGLYDKFIA